MSQAQSKEYYERFFQARIEDLHREGRYRVFANIERMVGKYPKALFRTENG